MAAKFSEGNAHIAGCYQLEKESCKAGVSLHGEPIDEHWWSGWPGAWCMKCHAEDKDELCLADCKCFCHDQFWAETPIASA